MWWLIRETYGHGHQDQWALMDTRPIPDPLKPREQCGLRVAIEERHRILKCFHDLSDFSSRCFNVIVAQVVFILLSYTLRQWTKKTLLQAFTRELLELAPEAQAKALSKVRR